VYSICASYDCPMPPSVDGTQASGSQTVGRAIKILSCFTTRTPGLTLTEVSRQVGLSLPTTHRLLRTLQSHDLVALDETTRRYGLGPGLIRLAQPILRQDGALVKAAPILERLCRFTRETVAVWWLVGHERVCVFELISPEPIHMASGVGQTYPLYAGAGGKALLAYMTQDELESVLRPLDLNRAMKIQAAGLKEELDRIRRSGYATSLAEIVPGAASISAALRSASGRPLAAINVTGPVARFTPQRMDEVATALLEAVRAIGEQWGGNGQI